MKKFIFICLMTLGLLSVSYASESSEGDDIQVGTPMDKHLGPYLEAALGSNLYYLGVFSDDNAVTNSGITGTAWSGAIGYNFTTTTAMELGFMQNYAEYKDDHTDENESGHTNIPYLTMRWNVGLTNRVGLIFKTGLMMASAVYVDDSSHDVGSPSIVLPFVGVGGSFAVNKNINVVLQYQGAIYGIVGAGGLLLGLDYNFDA